METIHQQTDIKVFYVTASSYPEGVLDAHQKLHSIVPFSTERRYFGISRPENGPIIYRAATEETKDGEAESYNLETLVLNKGNYISLTVNNYLDDIEGIERAFQSILSHPNLDPNGYCVEWYFTDKDVKCMIRLED